MTAVTRAAILTIIGRQRAIAAKLRELAEETAAAAEEAEETLDEIVGLLADPEVPNLDDLRCEPPAAAAEKEARARLGAEPETPRPWARLVAGAEKRQ